VGSDCRFDGDKYVAAAFGAGPVGPGPLDVGDALSDGMDVAAIGRRRVLEACIGETLAALEAAEASQHTSDQACSTKAVAPSSCPWLRRCWASSTPPPSPDQSSRIFP